MSFVDSIKTCFTKYVDFNGRARRSEYWYFSLFTCVISTVLSSLSQVTGSGLFTALAGIFSLAILLPGLGVSVRRLHDIGKSGWCILLGLIPIAGAIILLVFMVKDSVPGANAYGPNPKEPVQSEF